MLNPKRCVVTLPQYATQLHYIQRSGSALHEARLPLPHPARVYVVCIVEIVVQLHVKIGSDLSHLRQVVQSVGQRSAGFELVDVLVRSVVVCYDANNRSVRCVPELAVSDNHTS
jgi:hypothetical protein